MRRTTMLCLFTAVLLFAACTKEPEVVDIEKMVEEVLAEMDWHADADTAVADGDIRSDELLPDDDALSPTDDLLSDD